MRGKEITYNSTSSFYRGTLYFESGFMLTFRKTDKVVLILVITESRFSLPPGLTLMQAWLPQLVPLWAPMAAWLNTSRSVWRIDGDPSGKVAGYVRTSSNLTQAVVCTLLNSRPARRRRLPPPPPQKS